jgi:hypothetical protein
LHLQAGTARSIAQSWLCNKNLAAVVSSVKTINDQRLARAERQLGYNLKKDVAAGLSDPLRGRPIPPAAMEMLPASLRLDSGLICIGGVAVQASVNHRGGVSVPRSSTASSIPPASKSHGGNWSRLKADFKAQSANDPKLPRHIRSWLQQEYNKRGSWYRVRNPPGFDIDHTRNNIDYLRWQNATDNRGRSKLYEQVRTRSLPPTNAGSMAARGAKAAGLLRTVTRGLSFGLGIVLDILTPAEAY